jgi:hypothetical protein
MENIINGFQIGIGIIIAVIVVSTIFSFFS